MKGNELSYKNLTKAQLESLKSLYINNRIDSMSEDVLRTFAKEVLELQVKGTVGNEEEREVWKEMKEYFQEDFEQKIKEVIKVKGSEEVNINPEQNEFAERLKLLEQRKEEAIQQNEDMWGDD